MADHQPPPALGWREPAPRAPERWRTSVERCRARRTADRLRLLGQRGRALLRYAGPGIEPAEEPDSRDARLRGHGHDCRAVTTCSWTRPRRSASSRRLCFSIPTPRSSTPTSWPRSAPRWALPTSPWSAALGASDVRSIAWWEGAGQLRAGDATATPTSAAAASRRSLGRARPGAGRGRGRRWLPARPLAVGGAQPPLRRAAGSGMAMTWIYVCRPARPAARS